MFKIFKEFPGKFKKYIDHIVTVSFGELLIYLIEILVLIAIPLLLASFCVNLVKDVLYYILLIFMEGSVIFFRIYDAIFAFIVAVCVLYGFVYLFNRRYVSFEKEIKEVKVKKSTAFQTEKVDEVTYIDHFRL